MRLRTKFIPSGRERWVINRLLRQGWSDNWNDYSENEMLLYIGAQPHHTDTTYSVKFFIHRERGCRMEYRDPKQPQLHYIYYMAWPTTKNWHEIANFLEFCARVYVGKEDAMEQIRR